MKTLLSFLLLAVAAFAQTGAPAAEPSFLSNLTTPNTLVMAGMVAAQLADAKTDWHYTIAGKSYTLTPTQRLGMAGGIFGATLAIEQAWPRARKPVQVIGSVVMAYFAGRALANTYNHGTAPDTAAAQAPTATPKIAFAVRIRR